MKTILAMIFGILFYMYIMSHPKLREDLINERVISHPEKKISRKW